MMGVISWFTGLTRRAISGERDPHSNFWFYPVATEAGGVAVTPDIALTVSAVYACVRVISETIASLPFQVFRRLDRGKDLAPDHEWFAVLASKPNRWQTSFEWREMMLAHVLLRGNAYSEIRANDELWPLHPDLITVRQLDNMRLRYEYRDPFQGGIRRDISQDAMLHIRGLSSDGIRGLSPIQLAKDTIGGSIARRRAGASMFRNSLRPSMLLKHPGKLKPEAAKRLRQELVQVQGGPENAGLPMIIWDNMSAEKLGMTLEDAQWIESQQFDATDIARIFRVPPHLIGDLTRATFSNIEHQAIEAVTYTFRPWCVRIEQAVQMAIIDDPQFFVEFNLDGLLRGDIKSRYDAYAVGRSWGWLSTNDILAKENMNPVPWGDDDHLIPTNMMRANGTLDPSMRESGPFIDDASARIAKVEIQALDARIDKIDDRERFNAWVIEFNGKHRAYVEAVLRPFGLNGQTISRVAIGVLEWCRMEPGAAFDGWRTLREQEVAEIIRNAIRESDPTRNGSAVGGAAAVR